MGENKQKYSWTIIIICFVLFWPLGLVLLVCRLSEDKELRNKIIPTQSNQGQPTFFRPQQQAAKKTEVCSGCGAPNLIIPGTPTICEYCGKKLV